MVQLLVSVRDVLGAVFSVVWPSVMATGDAGRVSVAGFSAWFRITELAGNCSVRLAVPLVVLSWHVGRLGVAAATVCLVASSSFRLDKSPKRSESLMRTRLVRCLWFFDWDCKVSRRLCHFLAVVAEDRCTAQPKAGGFLFPVVRGGGRVGALGGNAAAVLTALLMSS